MRKKSVIVILLFIFMALTLFGIFYNNPKDEKKVNLKEKTNTLNAMIINKENGKITVQDSDNIIYTFNLDADFNIGDTVQIEYDGDLDKNKELQDIIIKDYEVMYDYNDKNGIPKLWLDDGLFKKYYEKAYEKLENMTLDEKIAQILLVRYPDDGLGVLKNNQFGGYVFYVKDFKDKTYDEVKTMMSDLQGVSKIPILTAVDEEGGRVVRVSSNPNLASIPFKSSRELYLEGGFDRIKEDTIQKSKLLYDLGINLNLAPVIDVSTNSNDYMYSRSLGEDSDTTSEYAKTVISASHGLGVSYTLKHFPGYGNNLDTHEDVVIDKRSYEDILKNDLPPFKAGIDEGAEAVLVSHNIVSSVDLENPSSLSSSIHNLLRNELKFTGIIITDDLAMGATKDIENSTVEAILSGNDLIITTDYGDSMNSVKEAINNGTLNESLIDKLAFRVIAFKYYKGLIF